MQKRKCKNPDCKNDFMAVNGTQNYCSLFCYKGMKQQRQKVLDDLIKDFRKGIHKNYKLFRELLPQNGDFEIELEQAYKKGFDENAYYGTVINNAGENWHKVPPYYFHLNHYENSQTLNLYKR
jgi:hypothetical protein